jgi:hypothetical protein
LRKKIIFIGIIVLGIYLFFKLLGIFLFKTNENKPTELVEFKPTESLTIQTSKPVFYYSDRKLFYSKNGDLNLDKPIFKGALGERFYDNNVFVSPNSKFIAFKSENEIVIIDNNGNEIKNIRPIQNHILDNNNAFWESEFQWSKNSEKLFLMKHNKQKEASLYYLSVNTKELVEICNLKEQAVHFYLSPNQKQLFYSTYDNEGSRLFKKYDLISKKVTDTINRTKDWKLITQDSIFINFKSNVKSKELNKYIGQSKNDSLCNIYLTENDKEELLFKVNCGFDAFKGRKLGSLEHNMNIFLPNDRYFLTKLYSKDKNGTIVIDTKTLEYKMYEREVKAYFSNTRTNFDNVLFTWGEFISN